VTKRIAMPLSFDGADAIWSHSDPDIVFYRAGTGIAAYNVRTGSSTQIVDWSKQFADAPFSYRLTASENDDVFCWARVKTDYTYVGWGCFQRSTGQFWHEPADRLGQYAKAQIDKSGRWLWNVSYLLPPGIEGEVFDLANGGAVAGQMTNGAPDFAPGHGIQGPGWVIGADDWNNRDNRRAWDAIHTITNVTPASTDWCCTGEYTMLNTANDFYYVAITEMKAHVDGLFHDELIGRATDGSGAVRRLAHIHAVVNYDSNGSYDYWSIPKPSVSYSGKFVAFNSNWGNSGRRDVFVVRIPQFN
jgi:hypothetical protein